MKKFIFLLLFTSMSFSCTSLDSCKIGIIQYKVNSSNIGDVLNKDVDLKKYSTELIDTVVPGVKCTFY